MRNTNQALNRLRVLKAIRRDGPISRSQLPLLTDLSAGMITQLTGELLQGGLIATREPKQANRIQRLSLARLENRWTRDIDGGPVSLVVTRGDFQDEYEAKKFARWLASPEADQFVAGGERTVGTSI